MKHRAFVAAVGLLLGVLASNPLGPLPARAATPTAPRGVIFVHGIHGNALQPGFQDLLQPLFDAHKDSFETFAYFDDVANFDSTNGCTAQRLPEYDTSTGLPVDVPAAGAQPFCDSEDDVGLNAVLLDQDIARHAGSLTPAGTTPRWQADHITLIANSMGGAIVRAYLAYATQSKSRSLDAVDSVLFLQSAQEGSWLAKADQIGNSLLASKIPGVRTAVTSLEQLGRDQFQIDPSRPAIADLTPQSQTYLYASQAEYLPAIHYANVASDITTNVATRIWWWTITAELPVRLGDYVMVPGFDDPTRTDWMGGARFLPSVIGRGSSSTQWVLPGEATIRRGTAADGTSFWDTSEVLNAPMSHFQFGSRLAQLSVDTSNGQTSLDSALLNWVAALDGPSTAAATRAPQRPARGAPSVGNLPVPGIIGPADDSRRPFGTAPGSPPSRPRTAPALARSMTLVDQHTGLALVLQLPGESAKEPASFAFQVPGQGVYRGPIARVERRIASSSTVVDYDGPASLGPLISSTAIGAPGRTLPVHVQLRAEVDSVHHTAEANLVDGSRQFHLVSQPATVAREPALATFEAASRAADWRALYNVVGEEVRGRHTEASFAAEGARQMATGGRVRSLRRVGVDDVRVGQDGIATFRASYEVMRQAPNGSSSMAHYVATFLQQGGDWRLWFMDAAP